MRVLVVNAGSSSVKLRVVDDDDGLLASTDLGPPDEGLADALDDFVGHAGRLDVAGHRVVHGGERFSGPAIVDKAVRHEMEGLNELAPLHNPPALAGIDAVMQRRPGLSNVACFDTSFHRNMPPAATLYALPAAWTERWHIRRYGFHGLSCEWAMIRVAALAGREAADLRVVVCHLGGGASVTAIAGGRSVDTSMGFTPVEGLVMGTRSGDVDPGLLVWMLRQGLSPDELDEGLEHRAGLLGLSGGSTSDMQALLTRREEGDEVAELAVRIYLHRLCAKIAAMTAAIGGLDVLVFTGGVGEHAAAIRAEAGSRLGWMGVAIDGAANAAVDDDDAEITGARSTARTFVVHAREDLVIARACREALGARAEGTPGAGPWTGRSAR